MNDDDDLPVLTHVLRTASDHHPHALFAPLDDFDAPPTIARRIVIGNEPDDRHVDAPAGDAEDGLAPEPDIVADPRRTIAADAFRLNQDVDAAHGEPPPRIDVPALVASAGTDPIEVPGHDTELDFTAPAIADAVRRAVFDDLSARIDTELDARIAQAMRDEVETALAGLQERLRARLSDALRDVVARAVDEEVARMRWAAASRDRPH